MKKTLCVGVIVALAGAAQAAPIPVADLGVLSGDTSVGFSINDGGATGEVGWIRFEVGQAVTSPIYLDFTTNNSFVTNFDGFAQTEIGLYDDLGNLIVFDFESGLGFRSTLTFGAGSGLALGDPFDLGGNGLAEGENGNLGAGVYWLAVGAFNTTFGSNFNVTGGATPLIIAVDIYTNLPAPGAVALLGLGGLAAVRRRR